MTFFTANVIGYYSDFFVTLSGVEGSSIASQRSLGYIYIYIYIYIRYTILNYRLVDELWLRLPPSTGSGQASQPDKVI
jgi:hypothetical protein